MFKQISASVATLGGTITPSDLSELNEWLEWEGRTRLRPLMLLISSGGGVINTKTVKNMLATNIHVHIAGPAESAAATIALAASTRSMYPGSYLMVHQSSVDGKTSSQTFDLGLHKIEYEKMNVFTRAAGPQIGVLVNSTYLGGHDNRIGAQKLLKTGIVHQVAAQTGKEPWWESSEQAFDYYKKHIHNIQEFLRND